MNSSHSARAIDHTASSYLYIHTQDSLCLPYLIPIRTGKKRGIQIPLTKFDRQKKTDIGAIITLNIINQVNEDSTASIAGCKQTLCIHLMECLIVTWNKTSVVYDMMITN